MSAEAKFVYMVASMRPAQIAREINLLYWNVKTKHRLQ